MKKYSLTPEHRAQLKPWADRWIANALSTKQMDDADREAMRDAIKGLYEAANLAVPKNIVFVPSPLVGNIAAGFAAGIWYKRRDATYVATDVATSAATRDATRDATDVATSAATSAATRDATDAARWGFRLSIKIFGNDFRFGLSCAQSAWRMRNGGNHWSGWCGYISFFRHVAKLDLPIYDKWQHYENAAIHGSWRWMHQDFCIVSDRPKTLKIDAQNRPHCADGPSHEWRDGWKLYYWHGLKIPAELIEKRHEMTAQHIAAISNAEHRRAAIEIYAATYGPDRFVKDLGAKLISKDVSHGRPRRLYQVGDARFIHVVNGSLEPDGSRREFLLGAEPSAKTPKAAIAASYGRPASKYCEGVRT